eukprot:TRINITY_DN2566_c0_g1_i1.p1 TRINITY_DN2566_c0_g1~~TRINITY_DN2566_c0_g1_i1.p1  ORF type:complete len:528 (-),score=156.31 TRINITY_DN2566_c0_g1_i1:1580-3163(-)
MASSMTSPPLPRSGPSSGSSSSIAAAAGLPNSPTGITSPLRRSMTMSEQEYIDSYKIDALLERIRNRLLAERPEDPLAFLSTFVDHLAMHNKFILEQEHARSGSLGGSEAIAFNQVVKELTIDELSSPEATSNRLLLSPRKSEDNLDMLSVISKNLTLLKNPSSSTEEEGNGESKSMLGLDIGGSLAKVIFFEPADSKVYSKEAHFIKKSFKFGFSGVRDADLGFAWNQGRFHFLHFETRRLENAVHLLKTNGLFQKEKAVPATGGGAQKFSSVIRREFDCKIAKGDELACLLVGLNFLLKNVPDELYYLEDVSNPKSPRLPFDHSDGTFPYILANIGSGVSILLVKNEKHFKRVSGTSIGGGTFVGLCKLISDCTTFEEAVQFAAQGDPRNVDMTVGDIYGGDYKNFGLKKDTVASSFGKFMMKDKAEVLEGVATKNDMARSLLNMISINIAQLAYLCAMRYNVTRIVFAGNFLRSNEQAEAALSFSINYWSHGLMNALFLKHEGYMGALGAFLSQDTEKEDEQKD